MLDIIEENPINVEKGVIKVRELVPDVGENEIRGLLRPISLLPVKKKHDHDHYRSLKQWYD